MTNTNTHRSAAKELGVRLGAIASEKGISQKAISEATGISETTISRIFTGKFCAKSDYLICLAYALGGKVIIELAPPETESPIFSE